MNYIYYLLILLTILSLPSFAVPSKKGIPNEVKARLTRQLTQTKASPIALYFGSVHPKKATMLPVTIETSGCFRFSATMEKPGIEITLALFQDSVEVAKDRLSGTRPAVSWCTEKPSRLTVEIATFGGGGTFGLALFKTDEMLGTTPNPIDTPGRTEGTLNPIGGPNDDFIANRIRQLHRQFGEQKPAASPLYRSTLATEALQTFQVVLPAGCPTIISAGDPQITQLNLALTPSSKNSISAPSKTNFVVLTAKECPLKGGPAEITVTITKGHGQFGFQIFSK